MLPFNSSSGFQVDRGLNDYFLNGTLLSSLFQVVLLSLCPCCQLPTPAQPASELWPIAAAFTAPHSIRVFLFAVASSCERLILFNRLYSSERCYKFKSRSYIKFRARRLAPTVLKSTSFLIHWFSIVPSNIISQVEISMTDKRLYKPLLTMMVRRNSPGTKDHKIWQSRTVCRTSGYTAQLIKVTAIDHRLRYK